MKYIPPSLVERGSVLGISAWRSELEKEDVLECGAVVKRPLGELSRMYERYVSFQTSAEVTARRKEIEKR